MRLEVWDYQIRLLDFDWMERISHYHLEILEVRLLDPELAGFSNSVVFHRSFFD